MQSPSNAGRKSERNVSKNPSNNGAGGRPRFEDDKNKRTKNRFAAMNNPKAREVSDDEEEEEPA